jgi:hypothetical protein
VQRAKEYTFGSGAIKYRFAPDRNMVVAWKRMASGEGTEIDKVLLRHEIYESYLVVERGLNQQEAHKLAQRQYPWSNFLNA